jgi:hypothetical protein
MANKTQEGIESIISNIIEFAEHFAKEPGVKSSINAQYLEMASNARAAIKVKGIISENNTNINHPPQYVAAEGVNTKFDYQSFSDAVKQVETDFTDNYNGQVKNPRQNIAQVIKHLSSKRFFRGLAKDDALKVAKTGLSEIEQNGGEITSTFAPKELYSILKEAARKVEGFYKIETASDANPSPLLVKIEDTLNKYKSLQREDNITYSLPMEVAAAVIVAQYGQLGQQPRAPAKKAAAKNVVNINIHQS